MNNFCRSCEKLLVDSVRDRLLDFYSSYREYPAFQNEANKGDLWNPILHELNTRIKTASNTISILELGAGCSGLYKYLQSHRNRLIYHSHDVTPVNRAFLEKVSDAVFIGDPQFISGKYDIICSTFVWEHVSSPHMLLDHLYKLLTPGGCLLIISPRYDFPFYLSPSCRNRSWIQRFLLSILLCVRRLRVHISGNADFLIDLRPAVLELPFYRDADAIHWVSWFDLRASLPQGYKLSRLSFPASGFRERFWKRFLLLGAKIRNEKV
ncbi:MAG: methyltransferase domain-containing protein [Candidatus Riflebacteria bacterium]|nr:methyltransferase domain-containing protein [Candidatus Riflebacteria bacterium]